MNYCPSLFVSDFLVGVRLSVRAHFLQLALGCLCFVGVAAVLAALFSGRQPATVALDVGLSVIRLLIPLALVFLGQELFFREFDRRYFLNAITYPRARCFFVLGRFAVVIVLTLALLLVMALLLAFLVVLVGQNYAQGTPVGLGYHYLVTISFIGVELLLLAALSCLLAAVATTPSFILIGVFGFTLVARSFAAIFELLTLDSWVVDHADSYRSGVSLLGYLLPDLGALDVRMVALYGSMSFLPPDWPWLLLSSLAYTVSMLALAVWVLQQKQFA